MLVEICSSVPQQKKHTSLKKKEHSVNKVLFKLFFLKFNNLILFIIMNVFNLAIEKKLVQQR